MGPMEIGIILVIVLIIFGVGKLPQVGGAIGKSIREFRKEKEAVEEKPADKDIAKSSETDAKEKV
jgi:sec-independent protein translocase protein TatA